jgi:hypothetical protein
MIILIAAVAVGLSVATAAHRRDRAFPRRLPAAFKRYEAVQHGHVTLCCCALALSPAFLVVRLRRPRADLRRLIRQPGLVACVAATLGLVYWLASLARAGRFSEGSIQVLSVVNGLWVGTAWIVLLIVGWRAEPGWIDRMGLVLGICWLGLFLLLFASFWLI